MTVTETAVSARIDPARWPDVASSPHHPVRAAVARAYFERVAKRMPIRVREGTRLYGGGGPGDPLLRIERPDAFFTRLGTSASLGVAEGWMAGDWTTDDLPGVFAVFAANLRRLVPAAARRLRQLVVRPQPTDEDNTIEGARRNIHRHYDLSNEMFAEFLDESMTYSSALFNGEPSSSTDDLHTAQRRKIDRLLDIAHVGQGSRVLEIGTGWGELAIRAASRGAKVTTLTISTEQANLARQRIASAGMSERVNVQLKDYRVATGRYDAVVSVEMIEAVGLNHLPAYFSTMDRVLLPGGRVGLQAILMADEDVRATEGNQTWIRKYIFPGGQIASVQSIEDALRSHTSLRVLDHYHFGHHYAETLRRWRARFEERWQHIAALGFDDVFRRMWTLYLAYSEAGFRTSYLDVAQFTLAKRA